MDDIKIRKWDLYKKKWTWRNFYFHKVLRRHIFERYFHYDIVMPFYAGKRVLNKKKTNDWIIKKIQSGEPFMVSRFGNTELQTVISVLEQRIAGNSKEAEEYFEKWFGRLGELSGFFPLEKELASDFTDLLIESCKQTDLLAMWHCNMEDYMINEYIPGTQITYLTRIEPWRTSNPWTMALKGKKVLVIHPFEKTITMQYRKRKQLFIDENILPDFDLLTLKAVQTIAGMVDSRFKTWFEALEYMYEEAMKKNFDIAIIGCGAYGMPLAAKIKSAGKQAIHMGGVTQLLFGIKGKRWVESPMTKIEFNDSWVYPDETETPKGSEKVEDNCYWK